MSDGPYKTLPMRPRWKVVAKRAYLEACGVEEVAAAMAPALSTDWRSEVSTGLVARLLRMLTSDEHATLFPEQKVTDIASLSRTCASAMEATLVSATADAVLEGCLGPEALQRGAEATLEERYLSACRQIEEHMAREASSKRTKFVRDRLEQAVPNAGLADAARRLLDRKNSSAVSAVARRTDLDDGVALRS